MLNTNHREKYQKLLNKFCGEPEILELIEECILDDIGQREMHYEQYREYPEQRELINKLKMDLIINLERRV